MKLTLAEIPNQLNWLLAPKSFSIHCLKKQAESYNEHARFYLIKANLCKGEKDVEYLELLCKANCYQRAERRINNLILKYTSKN
ncbi:MAG: hypothetical protein ABI390_05925 [Daejeonella sp.]